MNSAIGTTTTVANLLSMGAAGVAGDAIGMRNVFLFCGVMAVLAAIVGVFWIEEPAERGRRAALGLAYVGYWICGDDMNRVAYWR